MRPAPAAQAEWLLGPSRQTCACADSSCSLGGLFLGLSVEVPDPTTTLASQTTGLLSRPSGAVVHVARGIAAFGNLLLGCGLYSGLLGHDPFPPTRTVLSKRPEASSLGVEALSVPGLKAPDENEQNPGLAGPLSSCFQSHVALSSLPSPASGFPTEGGELGSGAQSRSASGPRSWELSSVSTFSPRPSIPASSCERA